MKKIGDYIFDNKVLNVIDKKKISIEVFKIERISIYMSIKLPKEFEDRMQDMLKEAYPAFLASYENDKYQALRVNSLKVEQEVFLENVPFDLRKVAWEKNGFYYDNSNQPGKHPWHEAGVYYIQEPSAMSPAAYLEAQPGEKILDLCAAPGGKSTQIASYMRGKGLLVCNEIHPARAKILSENVERMGIPNALVTNENPQKLAEIFEAFFDRIMVDAPCSGEGMFRKNADACDEWSLDNVKLCAERQDEILDCADTMLRPGGRIVFSTCTFAPAENEGTIYRFLQRHPDYDIVEVPIYQGMDRGIPEWAVQYQYGDCEMIDMSEEQIKQIDKTIRLWPHKLEGEGHYVAVLQKRGEVPQGYEGFLKYGYEQGITIDDILFMSGKGDKKALKEKKADIKGGRSKNVRGNKSGQDVKNNANGFQAFLDFQKETLQVDLLKNQNGGLLLFGEQLYLIPQGMPALHGLKVMRPGLHLGTVKKDRFEPSHALALYLREQDVKHVMPLQSSMTEVSAFINGQTLQYEGEKGWYLISVDGYSLGWGKLAGTIMKNHYPKGLRK